MYYSVPPYKDTSNIVKGWVIGIAQSADLFECKEIGEITPQADYERKGLCTPTLLVIGDTGHIFYQTYGNGAKDAICHATSLDGISFTRNESNPIFRPTGKWTCGRAIDAEVVKFKNQFLLYFATRDAAYTMQYQGVAATSLSTSFNRNEWVQLSDPAIIKPILTWEGKCVEAASVIQRGKKLVMFYAGSYNNTPQQIGVAISKDGIAWKRLFDEPFLTNGKKGEWNF